MSSTDVVDRSVRGNSEQTHQPNRIRGLSCLIEEPVLPKLRGVDPDPVAHRVEVGDADRRPVDVHGGDGADDQMGVAAQWPAAVTLNQPVLDQLQGELVQADLVVEPVRPADPQTP
ncbi:hypothetical protein [Streptomyces sp. NPDC002088]|uniref:hypothetical protein n=1 Tax=Streptomyces sp. NPDC002088 TaxID=3154665 RepID=UPI0033326F08